MYMKYVLSIVLALSLLACTSEDELLIRVKNTSAFEFTNIVVNTGGGEHQYGSLISGEASTYKSYKSAYNYAFIELQIEGETYTIQPIDYVGETQLSNGKYTYEVNAATSGEQYSRLSINLKKN